MDLQKPPMSLSISAKYIAMDSTSARAASLVTLAVVERFHKLIKAHFCHGRWAKMQGRPKVASVPLLEQTNGSDCGPLACRYAQGVPFVRFFGTHQDHTYTRIMQQRWTE